jgi:hypothetical protein
MSEGFQEKTKEYCAQKSFLLFLLSSAAFGSKDLKSPLPPPPPPPNINAFFRRHYSEFLQVVGVINRFYTPPFLCAAAACSTNKRDRE